MGHLLAISNSLWNWSSDKFPVNEISISIRSTILTFAGLAAESSAWIVPHERRTFTPRRGHLFRSAYIRTVILVHVPSAAKSNSYGLGPSSLPPKWPGSSAENTCGPIEIFWRYLEDPELTHTSRDKGVS